MELLTVDLTAEDERDDQKEFSGYGIEQSHDPHPRVSSSTVTPVDEQHEYELHSIVNHIGEGSARGNTKVSSINMI
jgi:hypothetical protein